MDPRKEREWADRTDDYDRPCDIEPTYPDGSVQNECWSEKGYTRRTSGASYEHEEPDD